MLPVAIVAGAIALVAFQPGWVEQQTGIPTTSPSCHATVVGALNGTVTSVPAGLDAWCVGSVKTALTHPDKVNKVNFDLSDIHLPKL